MEFNRCAGQNLGLAKTYCLSKHKKTMRFSHRLDGCFFSISVSHGTLWLIATVDAFRFRCCFGSPAAAALLAELWQIMQYWYVA